MHIQAVQRREIVIALAQPVGFQHIFHVKYLLCLMGLWYQAKVKKAVKKIFQKWSRSRIQPKTDAPYRLHIVPARYIPQLAAQIADVGLQ